METLSKLGALTVYIKNRLLVSRMEQADSRNSACEVSRIRIQLKILMRIRIRGGGGGRSAKNVQLPWQNPRYAPVPRYK